MHRKEPSDLRTWVLGGLALWPRLWLDPLWGLPTPQEFVFIVFILAVQSHCRSRIPDSQGGLEGVLRRGGRQIRRHRGTSPGEQCCCRFWNPGSPGWLPARLESERRWQHPPAEACKAGVSSGNNAYNGIATDLSPINPNFLKKYIFPLNKKYE